MSTGLRKTASGVIMVGTTALMVYYLMLANSSDNFVNVRSMRHFWNNMGWLSVVLGIAAVGLWQIKKTLIRSHKTEGTTLNGNNLVLLREGHILAGWVALVLGLGHSAYYLMSSSGRAKYTVTGIAATIVMVVLIQIGALYQYKAIKLSVARKLHFALSIVLGVVMLTHI